MTRFALHGFLGLPSDWKEGELAVNLFKQVQPFRDWAVQFNDMARQIPGPRHLIGYSLGGRLGLHALILEPELWSSALFLSTHPGLKSGEERERRKERDRLWSQKFLSEPWDLLMKEWNDQPVLQGSSEIVRLESDFNRKQLADALIEWSLGNQEDLSGEIQALRMPIQWVVGEKDRKFCEIAETLRFQHPESKVISLAGCGHRDCLHHF